MLNLSMSSTTIDYDVCCLSVPNEGLSQHWSLHMSVSTQSEARAACLRLTMMFTSVGNACNHMHVPGLVRTGVARLAAQQGKGSQ